MTPTNHSVGESLYEGFFNLHEGSHYNYTNHGHTFIKSVANPDQREIAAINDGKIIIALLTSNDVIILLFNLGSEAWEATHYNWWINPPELRPDPIAELPCTPNGIPLRVLLVDSSNGKIAAAGMYRIPENFSRALLKQTALQAYSDFDPYSHLETFQEICWRYPEKKDLLNEAICVFSQGLELPVQPTGDGSFQDLGENISL